MRKVTERECDGPARTRSCSLLSLMSQLASIVNLRSTQLLIILEDQIICLIIDAFSCILISVSRYLHI